MSSNKRSMNEAFGKRQVVAHQPDSNWPLPNELVGIEIEVEDLQGSTSLALPEWTTHSDGSLRNGVEFVLAAPSGGNMLTSAIDRFFAANYRYNMSERTSTHIHINASDNLTFDNFRTMFVIMYLIEPAVFRWADENRKWCGYCSPLTDLSPNRLVPVLTDNSANAVRFIQAVQGSGNSDRYYGYNMAAYNRHGTVEFRYFPCTNNKETLTSWVKFVMYVKATALKYDNPTDLLVSLNSPAAIDRFFTENFGDVSAELIRNIDHGDAVGRAADLLATFTVDAEKQANPGPIYNRSRGMLKLIASKFPERAGAVASAKSKTKRESAYGTLDEVLTYAGSEDVASVSVAYQQLLREAQRQNEERVARQRVTMTDTPATSAPNFWGDYISPSAAADILQPSIRPRRSTSNPTAPRPPRRPSNP